MDIVAFLKEYGISITLSVVALSISGKVYYMFNKHKVELDQIKESLEKRPDVCPVQAGVIDKLRTDVDELKLANVRFVTNMDLVFKNITTINEKLDKLDDKQDKLMELILTKLKG